MRENKYIPDNSGGDGAREAPAFPAEIGEYLLGSRYKQRLKKSCSPWIAAVIVFCGLLFFLEAVFQKNRILMLLGIFCGLAFIAVCFALLVIPVRSDYKKFLRNASLYTPIIPLEIIVKDHTYITRYFITTRKVSFEVSFRASDGNVYRKETKKFYTKRDGEEIMNAFREKRLRVLYFPYGGRDTVILPDF